MSLDIWGRIPTENIECPNCGHKHTLFKKVFDFNITHNLKKMAGAAGCAILWDAWDIRAWELITPLRTAITNLENNPKDFDKFSAPNGWGTREQFVPWLKQLLEKCEEFPQAIINISK